MGTMTIDLSHEATDGRLDRVIGDGRAWTRRDIDPDDQVFVLGRDAMAEVTGLAGALGTDPLPRLLRASDQMDIPALRSLMGRIKDGLDHMPGFAVLDRLPLDDLDRETAITLFWILGQLIGRPVAQKWDGTMLYDVRDTGQAFGDGVRGSYTNVELVFHVDNAFGVAPPDYVGLFCLRPARHGGVSRFCSFYTVHNRLLEGFPEALERLYRPLPWDRQQEHAEGAPRVALAPMFRWDGERLNVRANVSLVHKGYGVAGTEMDQETAAALDAVAEVTADPEIWVELPIERGQLQYLNNREIAHYRDHFTDEEDAELKRHLVRTWHRDWGRPSYDG